MGLSKTGKPVKDKEDKIISGAANKGTEAKLRRFLENYGKTGRILRSCEMAGISFVVHYRRLQGDATYRAAFELAEQQAAQRQEDNVCEMADDGELQAALALLRRFRPQHYRERASLEVSGTIDLATALTQARSRMVAIDADPDTRKAS